MKITLFRTVLVFLLLAGGLQLGLAQELVLAGSTTVQKRILEPAAAAIETATGITMVIRGINSGKGFEQLQQGVVKASISSSPLSLLLEKAGLADDGTYQEHVILKDVIVPIVNLSNPVTELTWTQLADINSGKISNWKDVGGADKRVVVITSQPTAATRTVFQSQVMKGESYVKGIREVKSTRQEVDLVSKFSGGIGAVSEGFVLLNPGKVKVVKTTEISRPLSIITKGKPDPVVQKLIDFLKSSEAARYFQ